MGALHVPQEHGLATLGTPKRFTKWIDQSVHVEILDDLDLPKPNFIKLDVEGAELSVLRGAAKTLASYHPPILCEYAELNTRQFGYEPVEIDEFLYGLGYAWLNMPPWDRLYVAF